MDKPSDVNWLDILTLLLSSLVGIAYYQTKHWALNNVFGICFSIFGIANLQMGQYSTGFILLGLLFFYDIFFVFGTDIMVTVAKSLDGPIKLIFPKNDTFKEFSMIGLGDIVIPGIFVAFMARMDFINYLCQNAKNIDQNIKFNLRNFKFFFFTIFGYILGIAITLFIMFQFNHPQPALLYLVPGCLITSLLMGLISRNFLKMWNFDEEVEIKSLMEKQVKKDEKANK